MPMFKMHYCPLVLLMALSITCQAQDKTLTIQLQPNSQEPVAFPPAVRVNNRARIRFTLIGVSPTETCSRYPSAPTATAETPVAESLATTIATAISSGVGIGSGTAGLLGIGMKSSGANSRIRQNLANLSGPGPAPACDILGDPEYQQILRAGDAQTGFPHDAASLIAQQTDAASTIDNATRRLADFAARDYRGTRQAIFRVDGGDAPVLNQTRSAYNLPLNTIPAAGLLQAQVDEMAAWAQDLHKKYDYPPSSGGPPTGPPPAIPGVLMAAPTSLSLTPSNLTATVQIAGGSQPATFTATPVSDTGWLLISALAAQPGTATITATAPNSGVFSLIVTVNAALLDSARHYGAITITGTGAAAGTTIVNVTYGPAGPPLACDLQYLRKVDEIVDQGKAEMSLISDDNKTLESAQASLKTAYLALVKVEDDYKRRRDQQGIIQLISGQYVQTFDLGTDRKNTDTGYFQCTYDNTTSPTTVPIYYSILYQDVPGCTALVGVGGPSDQLSGEKDLRPHQCLRGTNAWHSGEPDE
jgi:hypothetical protein